MARSKCLLAIFGLSLALDQAVPNLDPSVYAEPTDAEYWNNGVVGSPPFDVPRVATKDLTRETFEKRIMDGKVFVVEDLSHGWPMANWDCDYFRKDETFSKAEMTHQYVEGGASAWNGLAGDWLEKAAETPSGAKDPDAPQIAPHYWGIKDVQFQDSYRSKTWKKGMLKKVQQNVRLPEFMHEGAREDFKNTPEFWFSAGGAGAKAHMDTHVQATMSIQIAGTKRWRVRYMDPRNASYLSMIYQDGEVYDRYSPDNPWQPHFVVDLQPGMGMFFPAGLIHETKNLGTETGSCSASVTFQFNTPMASRFYRRFFPRVRRTADIHEVWPLIAGWATLSSRKPPASGLPYEKAKAEALSAKGVGATFIKWDRNQDNSLSMDELKMSAGPDALSISGWHDLDEDGSISRAEFAEAYAFWAGTVKAVVDDTPKKWRSYQLKDMKGDFTIEDLPTKVCKEMTKTSQKAELERASGAAPRTEL